MRSIRIARIQMKGIRRRMLGRSLTVGGSRDRRTVGGETTGRVVVVSATTSASTSNTSAIIVVVDLQGIKLSIKFSLPVLQGFPSLSKFLIAFWARVALENLSIFVAASQSNVRMFHTATVWSEYGLGGHCVAVCRFIVFVHHAVLLLLMVLMVLMILTTNLTRYCD